MNKNRENHIWEDQLFELEHKLRDGSRYCMQFCKETFGSVHARDNQNNSLLHIAVRCDYSRVITFLMENGIDVNHINAAGDTALSMIFREHQYKNYPSQYDSGRHALNPILCLLNNKNIAIHEPIILEDTVLFTRQDILSYLLFYVIRHHNNLEDVMSILAACKSKEEKKALVNRTNNCGLTAIETLSHQNFRCAILNELAHAGSECASFKKRSDLYQGTFDPTFFKENRPKIRQNDPEFEQHLEF